MGDERRAYSGGPGRSWGFWATVGGTLLGVAVLFGIRLLMVVAVTVVRLAQQPTLRLANLSSLAYDGTLLSLATLASTPAVLALVAILAGVRLPVGDYLALRWPRPRSVALAVVGLGLFLAASDGLKTAIGRPLVPPAQIETYRTAWVPLLVVALLLCAPLAEEVLFRGFLFRGLADSRLGPGMAIGLTALAWTPLHAPGSDLFEGATVYLLGLYLGTVRHLTRSVPLTILLHALAAAAFTTEAAILVNRMGPVG